jgi:uncharacterized DUF497 family protein
MTARLEELASTTDNSTLCAVEFEWDDTKAASNYEKHGISFEDAATIFAGPTLVERSDRGGEKRWTAVGRLEGRLITVVFTRRGESQERVRIISARRARSYEREAYRREIA